MELVYGIILMIIGLVSIERLINNQKELQKREESSIDVGNRIMWKIGILLGTLGIILVLYKLVALMI